MNHKSQFAPVAIFVYQRLKCIKKLIASLKKNFLAKNTDLYFFSDGAKTLDEEKRVLAVRNFIKKIKGFKNIYIQESSKNLGLAESIISGINKVLSKNDKIIVLEEDLILSPNFLNYMNKSLKYYELKTKVMSISGSTFSFNTKGIDDYYFLKHISSHGWATWKNRWKFFKNNPDYFIKKLNKEDIKNFDYNSSGFFWPQILANKKKKIKTWAIFWYASIFIKKGFCLYPKKSLAVHIGNDKFATHAFDSKINLNILKKKNYIKNFNFPKKIQYSLLAEKRFEEFAKKNSNNFFFSRLKNLYRKLKKIFI
jgi:hypothetical protein